MTNVKTSDLARLLVAIHEDIPRLEILLDSLAIREKELLGDLNDAMDKIKASEGVVQVYSDEWYALQDHRYGIATSLSRVREKIRTGKALLLKARNRHARVKKIYDNRRKPVDRGLIELLQDRKDKKRGN